MPLAYPRNPSEWTAALLLLIAAALAMLTAVGGLGYATAALMDPNSIRDALTGSDADPNQQAALLAENDKLVEELKSSGMFAPLPPKPSPHKEISGILGSQVLMKGKWYKVGDTMAGAKVLAIEATCVKIEWEGKEMTLAPMKARDAAGPATKQNKPKARKKKPRTRKPQTAEEPEPQAAPAEIDDLAWLDIPEHLKAKIRVFWDQMTDEQKQKAKEDWENMSEDQKQQAIDAWSSM